MKILQLISSGGFYGAENVILELSRELNCLENVMPIIGVVKNLDNPHVELIEVGRGQGIETVTFPCRSRFDLHTIARVRNFLKDNDIDIIHSHGYKANLYSMLASFQMPLNKVVTCHNWIETERKMGAYARLDRMLLRGFDHVVAVSEDVKEKVVRSGTPAHRVVVIRNGVSISAYETPRATQNREECVDIPEGAIVVGTVGRLSTEKGQRHLLNTYEAIRSSFPNVVYLLIGDGSLRHELEGEYRASGVIFVGSRRDVPLLYRKMDVFCLPSLTEGLPMVLLEAMASGLPVVASGVGAIPQVVKDGESGLLVKPGDEDELKRALLVLLRDDVARHRMGRVGVEIIRESYSSRVMAAEYLKIYDSLEPRLLI